jgi:hypothetical protein
VSRADHPSERVREASAFTRAAVAWARAEELATEAELARIRRDRAIRAAVWILAVPATLALFALALHELGDLWRELRP